MSETLEAYFLRIIETVRSQASFVAFHLARDHPVTDRAERERGTGNIRKRGWLRGVPRLWHKRKVYAHYLAVKPTLWLGTDGVLYSEEVDWFGNSYFVEADLSYYGPERLRQVTLALYDVDPCCAQITA